MLPVERFEVLDEEENVGLYNVLLIQNRNNDKVRVFIGCMTLYEERWRPAMGGAWCSKRVME